MSYKVVDYTVEAWVGGEWALTVRVSPHTGLVESAVGRLDYQCSSTNDGILESYASFGAPIVGTFSESYQRLMLNPIPPPAWLEAENAEVFLGTSVKITKDEHVLAMRIKPNDTSLNAIETWTVDSPIFPALHTMKFGLAGEAPTTNLTFQRLTKEPVRALDFQPRALPRVNLPLHEWNSYPPLGAGEPGRTLQGFFDAVGAQSEIDTGSNSALLLDVALRERPSVLPVDGLPVETQVGYAQFLFEGAHYNAEGERELIGDLATDWRASASKVSEGYTMPATRPLLLTLADVLQANAINWTDGGHLWNILIIPFRLDVTPASAVQLQGWTCDGDSLVIESYSLQSGLLLSRQTQKARELCARFDPDADSGGLTKP